MMSARQRKLCNRLEAGRSRLFRMAYSWSHNQDVADEVVQETMIKAMHNIDKVKNIDAIDSWLFRVLSNCFIDICRKRREEVDIDDITLFEQETPESVHQQNEMLVSVRTAIADLPFKHRQVVTLVDIESFSYAEVADILGVPQGTVMSRLNRARQSLKNKLNVIQQNEAQQEDSKTKEDNKAKLKVVK
jgi:RNA polymerase sigma-70 factor (ECF subfamily)